MKRFVFCFLLTFLVFNLVNAADMTFTDDTGPYQTVDFNDTLYLSKFNPAWGTLNIVQLTEIAYTIHDITITNNDEVGRTIWATVRFPIEFDVNIAGLTEDPDLTVISYASTYPGSWFEPDETKVVYDVEGSDSETLTYFLSSDLAKFTGTGNFAIDIQTDASNTEYGFGGASNVTIVATTDARAEVRVKYYYDEPVPVELSTFMARYIDNAPSIYWTTQTESDNSGFNIYRGESYDALENDEAMQINSLMIPGAGTTFEPTDYSFIDEYPVEINNTYWYWIESKDGSGETDGYGPISITIPDVNDNPDFIPEINTNDFYNYPNPFYPQTSIKFAMKEAGFADLTIYNTKGQKVKTLFSGDISADNLTREVAWNGKDSSGREVMSGIYLYVLKTDSNTYTKKMILTK